jgi:hypothetical protein
LRHNTGKLLPVHEAGIDKAAGVKCKYLSFAKRCKIYESRPKCCRLWNCRWLIEDDAADLRRPDRSHYVIDILPDLLHVGDPCEEYKKIAALQIWVDPLHPEAHRDPALRAYLEHKNMPAIIRYDGSNGFVLLPPQLTDTKHWLEHRGGKTMNRETTVQERAEAMRLAGEELVMAQ